MKRVVITGMGVVSCLGNSVEEMWARLIRGESGLSEMSRWDASALRNARMGEVKDFPWDDEHDEASQFALFATGQALAQSGLADGHGLALVSATNFAGASSWESYLSCLHAGLIDAETAELFREFCYGRAAELLCERYHFAGPKRVLSLSCSSGTAALGQAMDLIRLGKAPAALCEGHDSLAFSSMAGLSILRTITNEEIRPFDARRSGTIFGEGAAALVLEDLDHAVARGATIFAEVLGYAANNNAFHLTAPDKEGEGLVAVLQETMRDAGVAGAEIDYINAHGTGTSYFDVTETRAVKTVLGARAYQIPMSSIKPAVGHMMAAAGAVEAIATVCAMRDGIAPPTLHLEQPDPACDLDYVPAQARACAMRTALSISSGIGGNNAAVALRRY